MNVAVGGKSSWLFLVEGARRTCLQGPPPASPLDVVPSWRRSCLQETTGCLHRPVLVDFLVSLVFLGSCLAGSGLGRLGVGSASGGRDLTRTDVEGVGWSCRVTVCSFRLFFCLPVLSRALPGLLEPRLVPSPCLFLAQVHDKVWHLVAEDLLACSGLLLHTV